MSSWPKEHNQDKAVKLILFLFFPFFAAIYSLRTLNRRSSYVVFFLFAVFYGMSFTVDLDAHIDGAAYRNWFEDYTLMPDYNFYDDLGNYLTFQGREIGAKKDFLFDFVSFYISRITDNYHVMFMVFAMIFAFFALKSFRFFTKEIDFKIGFIVYILAYLFMYNQISNINGLRFWTAAWIGVYCVFQIFRNNSKKYFLLLLFLPVIHASYLIFIVVVLLAYFLGNFDKIWAILFFISFVFSSISVEVLNSNLDILPPILKISASKYASQEYIELRSGGSGFIWVSRTMDFLVRSYIFVIVFLFIKNSKDIKKNSKTKSIYLFLLVYMTFVNFAMPIPSLGNRFFLLGFPIIAYTWIVTFKNIKYNKFIHFLPIIFWYDIYRSGVISFYNKLEWSFYFSSPILLIKNYLF